MNWFVMAAEIITKEDLQHFRTQLLNDLRQLFTPPKPLVEKKWLRSSEVRKLLHISAGTLQNLRVNNTLHPMKIGGIHYYDYAEIEALLTSKNKGA